MKLKMSLIGITVISLAIFSFAVYALIWGTPQQLVMSIIALVVLSFQLLSLFNATKKDDKAS